MSMKDIFLKIYEDELKSLSLKMTECNHKALIKELRKKKRAINKIKHIDKWIR